MKKTIILMGLIFSLSGKCENTFEQLFDADLPRKAEKIVYDDTGRIKELVNSSWTDRIKSKEGEHVYYEYNQGYNYDKKQGFLKIYNLEGELIEEKWSNTINGGVSQEEALIAIKLFKQDEVVKKQFSTTDKTIKIQTGFNFTDETECRLGIRCVHVFAESPEKNDDILAHSIVRLNDLSVPYPDFESELKKTQNKTTK